MRFKVAVVGGAGHVGLPLSCYIQNNKIQTLIIDKNKEALKKIKKKEVLFYERNLQEQLSQAIDNGLSTSTNIENIKDCNVVILTLGTSSNEEDKFLFDKVIDDIFNSIQPGTLLILRSTIESGYCNKILEKFNSNNKFIYLGYCPERLAEGNAFDELESLPQIVGTLKNSENKYFLDFFDSINIKTIFIDYKEAEFLKLFLNSYRYVQFSTINYYSNIAKKNYIDFNKILNVAKTEYPRLNGVPEPGLVGGPCLIKDNLTFVESFGDEFEILSKMSLINLEFINQILNDVKMNFKGNKIIQLGITFKPNSDDLRESQALLLNKILKEHGYQVKVVDPFIYKTNFNEISNFSENVLISTYHDVFKEINLENKKVIVVGNK